MPVLRVAVLSPLYRLFDYLAPSDEDQSRLIPGVRLRVPFGRGRRVGILIERRDRTSVEPARLKPVEKVLDCEPVLPQEMLKLGLWAAGYYHYPIGETLATMLPVLLRRGDAARAGHVRHFRITMAGCAALEAGLLSRAPRRAALLRHLASQPDGCEPDELDEAVEHWKAALKPLLEKAWLSEEHLAVPPQAPGGRNAEAPTLEPQQRDAVEAIRQAASAFQAFLLEGVTGSGKTEVYMRLVETMLENERQVLVLVPEISLTPQLLERFRNRFAVPLAVLHSNLSDRERLNAWLMAANGRIPIVIGTRSAIFTPLARLGLIIIDEEHDASYKQQEGLRYSARDIAVMRAQASNVPVVLGSATPSLESLRNAELGRYRHLKLTHRARKARPPTLELLDIRNQPMTCGLSQALIQRARSHLQRGEQVLLFINRRGFAPTLRCHGCGWVAACQRCDARMTLHLGRNVLLCHHCGCQRPVDVVCPECKAKALRTSGQGTEKVEHGLRTLFGTKGVVRIDRDNTRRKGSLEEIIDAVNSGEARILVGTQMLAKGHHFPKVTLVSVLDADQGLFGADFRSCERMAQLIVQVAGRAGREDKAGHVIIQTYHPTHPILRTLTTVGYSEFAELALNERAEAHLPPFSTQALLRAEATNQDAPHSFLREAQAAIQPTHPVELLGPVPAPMERRAGRWRAQLLVQAEQRSELHAFLKRWAPALESLRSARKVRWSLDVDPIELA